MNKKQKLLSVLLALALLLSIAPTFSIDVAAAWNSDGSGTADSPYIISSYADLNAFAASSQNTTYSCCIKLDDNFPTDSGSLTTPIGNLTKNFKGIFDGNGKTVKLAIDGSYTYAGMFGYVNGGTVKNVTVSGSVSGGSDAHVGGVVGCNNGTVTNCCSTAEVSGGSGADVGGVVGYNDREVTGCYYANGTKGIGYGTGTTTKIGGTGVTAETALANLNSNVSSGLIPWEIKNGYPVLATPVCMIEDTKYSSIAEAFKNLEDGSEITLLNNVTADVVIPNGKTVIIDLNGCTFSATSTSSTAITNNGDLWLVDDSNEGGGKVTGGAIGVAQNGTFTLDGKAAVTGNTANVYLAENCVITVDEGFIGSVGVTTEVTPTKGNPVAITDESAEAADAQYFFSDNAFCGVEYDSVNSCLELAAATYSASLTLNEQIDLNFKMSNLGNLDKAKLSIKVGDTYIADNDIEYDATNRTVSCTLKTLAPYEIGEELSIVVTYDSTTIKSFNYSAKTYCDKAIEAELSDELTNLCEALLNYGKYAEDYKNGNSDSTLNECCDLDVGEWNFSDIVGDGTIADSVVKGSAGAASLSIGSTVKLIFDVATDEELTNKNEATQNFFVLKNEGGKSVEKWEQIDPNRVKVSELTEGDYDYRVSIDMYASQLATQYTLKLAGVDTDEFCITYGVYNYCEDAQTMDSTKYPAFTDTLKNLCKAIYNYGEAVKAYNESKTN